jgi:hypothetical protein
MYVEIYHLGRRKGIRDMTENNGNRKVAILENPHQGKKEEGTASKAMTVVMSAPREE